MYVKALMVEQKWNHCVNEQQIVSIVYVSTEASDILPYPLAVGSFYIHDWSVIKHFNENCPLRQIFSKSMKEYRNGEGSARLSSIFDAVGCHLCLFQTVDRDSYSQYFLYFFGQFIVSWPSFYVSRTTKERHTWTISIESHVEKRKWFTGNMIEHFVVSLDILLVHHIINTRD